MGGGERGGAGHGASIARELLYNLLRSDASSHFFIVEGNNLMTQLLEHAISQVRELPEEKQDLIATVILEELEDDLRWEQAFATSQDKLGKWAKKVRADIKAGRFKEMDWDEI